MVGIFDTETRMLKRRKALGYVEVAIQAENIFGKHGNKIRGHEFHYSELARPPKNAKATYTICSRKGGPGKTEGYTTRNVLGSYVHLHFGSNPDFMKNFGQLCRK
jgi:cobyrinic acid a,c-diamide synthase